MSVSAKIKSRSLFEMASKIRLPIPGTLKMRSTTTLPPNMAGKIPTNMVINGNKLFRNTWRTTTSLRATPFALAVLWWSWADWSGYTKKVAMAKEDKRRQARIERNHEALGTSGKKKKR